MTPGTKPFVTRRLCAHTTGTGFSDYADHYQSSIHRKFGLGLPNTFIHKHSESWVARSAAPKPNFKTSYPAPSVFTYKTGPLG